MFTKKELNDIFVGAKSILIDKGWNKGSLINKEDGSVCLVGAIREHMYGDLKDYLDPYSETAYHPDVSTISAFLYYRYICKSFSSLEEDYIYGIKNTPSWNDMSSRTFEDIIDLLDKAILDTCPQLEKVPVDEELVTA